MKAIIPVAGVGARLRPHTHTQPKPLIPVAGKPILGHIIDSLLAVGIKKQVFIVGYLRDKIQAYIEEQYKDSIEAEFIVQEPRRGLGHALWVAKEAFEKEEEILIMLGDTIIFSHEIKALMEMEGSVLGVHDVDNPREFGVAVLNEERIVKKLIEKPVIPTSNLALVGIYKISQIPVFVEVLESMTQAEMPLHQEYLLTNALMDMVNKGVEFRVLRIENWFDCGRKGSLLKANRILLERIEKLDSYSFPNTVIIHPVHIGNGCRISNSILGPYVAIADNAVIKESIVKNAILGAYSTLKTIILDHSVVGSDTLLKGNQTSLNIGDNTEIEFGN
jgi:glucose-1-phosphate thymidylyltransferase